jgi:hypothetical protein
VIVAVDRIATAIDAVHLNTIVVEIRPADGPYRNDPDPRDRARERDR